MDKLYELKNDLLREENVRFYMCTDLDKLNKCFKNGNKFDSIWCKYFPSSLLNCNKNFPVVQTSKLKRKNSSSAKNDYAIAVGTTESSFLRLVSSVDIDNYKHEDYPGVLVLKEYFSQSEV